MKNLVSHRENIPLAVIGFNHLTADVQIREKAAFNENQQLRIMKLLSKDFNTRGSLILSTCNRTEIYVCGRKAIKFVYEICQMLDIINKTNTFCNEDITYIYTGKKAIHHFFRVITSLDSQIIGESQITGQVKTAYEKSRLLSYTDILINRMYNFGMQTEKHVRSKTYLSEGAVSISFAGVELARKIFGNLQKTKVVLIGAGDTAELAAEHFTSRDISQIYVVNRTYKNAEKVAKKFNGKAVEWSNLTEAIYQANIIITATSSDEYILNYPILEAAAKQREYKSIFLIDLAIPRDVDPSVSDIDGVFLYNLDSLQDIVNNNIKLREKEIPKAEKIVNKYVSEYIEWYNTLPVIKTITQLSQYFEEIREQEFERLKGRFSKENLEEAEYLSKSLMKKFLHHHIVSLRKSSTNPQRQKQHIDLVDEIYRLNGSTVNEDN
jgi:glutamyl-tRNA reductase